MSLEIKPMTLDETIDWYEMEAKHIEFQQKHSFVRLENFDHNCEVQKQNYENLVHWLNEYKLAKEKVIEQHQDIWDACMLARKGDTAVEVMDMTYYAYGMGIKRTLEKIDEIAKDGWWEDDDIFVEFNMSEIKRYFAEWLKETDGE